MKSVIRHLVTIFCALYLSGSHWMVLQTGAWTGMLISRAQSGSLVTAVTTTFDGEHPCSMCNAVSKGVAEERDNEAPLMPKAPEAKMVPLAPAQLPTPAFVGFAEWPQFSESAASLKGAPPTPPPLT